MNRWLLPHPLERATFHFISNTILRNARQRLFLAVYAGMARARRFPRPPDRGESGAPRLSFLPRGWRRSP